MKNLCLMQMIYQKFNKDTQNPPQILKYLETNATYDEQTKSVEYCFDSEQYINLKDLLFLRNEKVLCLQNSQLYQIVIELITTVLKLQQSNLFIPLKKKDIWLRTTEPLSNKQVNANFQIAFSRRPQVKSIIYNQDDLFIEIKEFILKIFTKICKKPFFGTHNTIKIINQAMNFDTLIEGLENLKLESKIVPQCKYDPEEVQQFLEIYNQTEFDQKFHTNLAIIFRNNLLNWVIKQDKLKQFLKRKVSVCDIFKQLDIVFQFNFFYQQHQQVISQKQLQETDMEAVCLNQYLKLQGIFNNLKSLKQFSTAEAICKLTQLAIYDRFQENEQKLLQFFPQSHEKIRSVVNWRIANILLTNLDENYQSIISTINNLIKEKLAQHYKEEINVDISSVFNLGYRILDQEIVTLFSPDYLEPDVGQEILEALSFQHLYKMKELYICSQNLIFDKIGPFILEKIKNIYFECYHQKNQEIVKKLHFE